MHQTRVRCTLDSQTASRFARGLCMALGQNVRREFGSALSRLLRGGVALSDFESWTLQSLIESLPPELRQTVEAQFQRYVLVQREVDGRALNFYPRRGEIETLEAPLLKMEKEEAPLLRIKISISDPPVSLHAVLHAAQGRAFSISFSQDVRPFSTASGFGIKAVEQSWRSNFSIAKAHQSVQPDRREDAAPG